jgi:hypothetical protein
MGIEQQVRPDLLTIITKIKRANPAFNYERVPDHEMTDAEAQWVAHELSHFILGHAGLLNRAR